MDPRLISSAHILRSEHVLRSFEGAGIISESYSNFRMLPLRRQSVFVFQLERKLVERLKFFLTRKLRIVIFSAFLFEIIVALVYFRLSYWLLMKFCSVPDFHQNIFKDHSVSLTAHPSSPTFGSHDHKKKNCSKCFNVLTLTKLI